MPQADHTVSVEYVIQNVETAVTDRMANETKAEAPSSEQRPKASDQTAPKFVRPALWGMHGLSM